MLILILKQSSVKFNLYVLIIPHYFFFVKKII